MAVHYYCRHCGIKIGTIPGIEADRMGLFFLTNEELGWKSRSLS
ncbi:anti-sigma-F factor Fin [Heyndrickxia coagulans]|nr:anti-sigma-F factor Fin [Heyndrickxia coagulans]